MTLYLLTNDFHFIAGQASVAAWCHEGRCYGATDIDTSGTAPLVITCDQVTGSEACTGTIYGAADVIFSNGKQLGERNITPFTR